MALQSRDLAMIGLGVVADAPPNAIQPQLADGIHLRWAFARGRGFPWHGFHLYRRTHANGDVQPVCLSRDTRTLAPGPLPGFFLDVSFARISSDTRLVLTDGWPPAGEVEFDLANRAYLLARFTPQARARRVIVRLGFRLAGEITITTSWDGIPMEQRRVAGRAGQVVVEEIEADSITDVHLTSGPAVLIDLCCVPLTEGARLGWLPVPGLRGPICLPVTQPGYPCSNGPEDVAASRAAARRRIRYGDPDRLTATPRGALAAGSVAVTNDSPLVTGTGTRWSAKDAGLILQISNENTAYVVAAVLSANRLVLDRPYRGVTGAGRRYTLQRDEFGQLHDYLSVMVSGGAAAGPMAGRMLPGPLTMAGTVATHTDSTTVDGVGTAWSSAHVGLRFRVVATSAGAITVRRSRAIVTGTGSLWTPDLVGMELEVDGHDRAYRIAAVDGPNRLRLARSYAGPDAAAASYRIVERPVYRVATVQSPTRLTLDSPYAGATAAGRRYELAVVLQAPGAPNQAPRLPRFKPFDIVLAAALDPAVAQMLGLYWIDETADPLTTYDYLVIADDAGIGTDATKVFDSWVQSGYANADGYIAYNLRLVRPAALAAPSGPRAYALPGVTLTTALDDVAGSAGLVWSLPINEDGAVLPRSPVMYHVWRADHGANAPGAPPPVDQFALRTTSAPVVVANLGPPSPVSPARPPDWPPLRLFFTDDNVREGWYSYGVSGVDIFGRHSAAGTAEWWQWAPVPDPRPWYYQDPAGDSRVHPYAIGLLDKTPPPPPAAVEAVALDFADPTLVRDLAFTTWQTALSGAAWYQNLTAEQRGNLIGVRVRWRWTASQHAQAPDAREFRIYFQPGRANASLGNIVATADTSAQITTVTTDIANLPPGAAPADAYAGARLHCGNDSWAIVGSGAASPLELRVRNIGPADDIRPPQRGRCSVVVPDLDPPHPRFTDCSRAAAWEERFHVVPYDQHWSADPGGDGRVYELFLPDAGGPVHAGVPLATSPADPRIYAQVGVSAADNKRHTADDPRRADPARWAGGMWGGADRYGNESRVGGPATIFRVHRRPPDPPLPPLDDESVLATRADYHSRSYYTVRWTRQPYVKTHIFRALDETLFATDWELRAAPDALDPDNPAHNRFFPSTPRWTSLVRDDPPDRRRRQVAADLNALNAIRAAGDRARGAAAYRALTHDALRILAGLPGRERAFTQLTIQPLDPDDPITSDRRGPDDPSAYRPDAALRSWVDTLDGRASNRYLYRLAHLDGAQNRSVFSLAWPVVRLPDATAPRAPVVTRITGGDREITLRWASNREADLAAYEIYRADTAAAVRDVRLMQHVHSEAVPPGGARPAEVVWTDRPVAGLVTVYYRLVATDTSGNRSQASAALPARAFDESFPVPPPLTVAWVDARGVQRARATWESTDETLLQRRGAGEGLWTILDDWRAAGPHSVVDAMSESTVSYEYRLRVRKATGASAIGPAVALAAAP